MPVFLFAIFVFSLGVVIGGLAVNRKLSKARHIIVLERKRVMALQNEIHGLHSEKQGVYPLIASKLKKIPYASID